MTRQSSRRPLRRGVAVAAAVAVLLGGGLGTPAPPTGPAVAAAAETASPPFRGTAERLPPRVRERMRGSSWRPGCPVPLRRLRLLRVTRWGFDGEVHRGRLVVHRDVADAVLAALRDVYDARFPIRRMRLVDAYGADDDRSMAANNTSAFNCRRIAGTTRWSQHAYGRAVDVNPVQNPYVSGSTVEPPAGARYTDRSNRRKGMVLAGGPVTDAFAAIGWGWGGYWRSAKDYQHFSATGG